jgi:hypothetical protein
MRLKRFQEKKLALRVLGIWPEIEEVTEEKQGGGA